MCHVTKMWCIFDHCYVTAFFFPLCREGKKEGQLSNYDLSICKIISICNGLSIIFIILASLILPAVMCVRSDLTGLYKVKCCFKINQLSSCKAIGVQEINRIFTERGNIT